MQALSSSAQSAAAHRPSLLRSSARVHHQQALRITIARAQEGPGAGKQIREFREDTGEVTVPGQDKQQKGADGTLYADQVSMPKKPQDNLSKEMKQRLRQEYYGLGGAENTVAMAGGRGMFVVAAAATAEPVVAEAREAQQEAAASSSSPMGIATEEEEVSSSSSAPPKARGASKWVIDEKEVLYSTAEHRAWTFGCMALLAGSLAEASSHAHSLHDAGVIGVSVMAAYVLSDLGTAVFHWGVDNYGDGTTPVLGSQIAAFQGHHQRPWTITQREFCNNVHQVFKPAAVPAAIILAACPWLPLSMQAFLPSFTFLCCMSQQFHAWSHMKKSELPALVVTLQDANLLIGRKAHGAHHKPNFEGNYSIVSGWWNPLLDNTGFFRALERAVAATTGVEPRCWYPPEHGWEELVQPQKQAAAAAAAGPSQAS